MNTGVLTSALTSIVMMALAGLATKLGWDATTTTAVAGAIVAIFVALIVAVWKAAARSNNAIVAEAAKIIYPTGGVIQTTPEMAKAIPADNVVEKKPGA